MSTIIKLTEEDGTPRYFTPTSISFRPRVSGEPGAAVWQGPEYHQHAERCPSDGTMDAGITDEHHVYVRETCDRQRDRYGDEGFLIVCDSQVLRYTDRAGLKGPFMEDMAKAWWWCRMYFHVRGEADDPRSGRPGFVGYSRALTARRNCHNCVHTVDRGNDCYDCAVWDGSEIHRWLVSVVDNCEDLPPRDADGCPDFSPK